MRITGPDLGGYGMQSEVEGDVGMAVEGTIGISVSEDSLEEVGSQKFIQCEGYELGVGNGDHNVNVLSDANSTIRGAVTKRVGQGRSTTINAPSPTGPNAEELTILVGNRQATFGAPALDTITFGSSGTRRIEAGGPLTCIWQSPTTGSFTFQAASGTYSVTLGTGSISMTAATVQMTAATEIGLSAPAIGLTGSVGLGAGTSAPNAVIGGVPGPSPYIDPFTGLPLTGNPLVRTV